MAATNPNMDKITTSSQKHGTHQTQKSANIDMEDNDSVSISSEFLTTEDSSTESPLVKRIALGSKSDTQEANGTQNGLPHGLILSPPKEELGAFVIQLDTAHWQHELQILSAMSTNKDLKVSASSTLNGKRIIRPLDSTTHLWLQSCTCISQKPVKFIQLIKKPVETAVMQNVHPFISMEALLADQGINTAERILSYNSSTKDMEPTRSVKVTLNMKTVPAELRINFIGMFYVRPYVTKPIRCYRCQRFGHVAAACLANGQRCSMCSGSHRTQQCLTKMQNSETVNLKCANCGEPHSANSNKCPVLHNKMHKKMTSVTTNLRITSMKHATPPPPLVTSAEFPAVPTSNNSHKVISESLSKTGNSYAAVAHFPRPVAMAARTATKAVTMKAALSSSGVHQNIKSKSVESQYPKEGSQDASTVEQPMKQGNRMRSAEQSMQSSTPVTDSMTSELASMQPLSRAETYDKIFTVLMTQMEQLRPLFAIQDLSAKNVVRKMTRDAYYVLLPSVFVLPI